MQRPDLPDPGEPMVLHDGSQLMPDGRVIKPGKATSVSFTPVPVRHEAQQIVARTRRRLADLPAVPKATNAVAVVLTYTLLGLNDEDIAIAMSLTIPQVANIRATEAYREVQRSVVTAIQEHDTDDIRSVIAQKSRTAVEKIGALMENAEDEAVQFRAAQDMLDRAGHRPADVVEHRHAVMGGLVIEVVDKTANAHIPEIEVNP